ncbi:glycosyltransferase [Actinomadura sp. 21ATH]|uniref:glycosyltransferase n=1 Tax=Actinomadura sp. 21ATH TaxID=1735444 RepID=UPI0035BF1716
MEPLGALDDAAARYARAVAAAVASAAPDDVVGTYLYGSGATGRFVPGRSDVDLAVVLRDFVGPDRGRDLLAEATAVRRPRSVKGLDLWVLPRAEARRPRPDPRYVGWALTAIDSELVGGPDRPGDARLVLLFAMCRQHAIALTGPPPGTLFADVDPSWVVDAMRVDLRMSGPAGWYRVLNACRTLHYLDTGRLCDRSAGAGWARGRVRDEALLDDALTWHETGHGPAMDPRRVGAFVEPVLARLEARADTAAPRGVPAVEAKPRITIVDDPPLVSCVLRAPDQPELLALAVRHFGRQCWPQRELLVLAPSFGAAAEALAGDERVRTVVLPPHESAEWAGYALQEAAGPIVATWDAATWYAPDRLRQQVTELLAASAQRVVAPSVLGYDPRNRQVRTLRDLATLEDVSLCARRHAWDQFGTAALRGERGDIAVRVGPVSADGAEPAAPADVAALLGSELGTYATAVMTASAPARWLPAVSCLMPTYNRRGFVARAIRYFARQDYANRELVILDDGEDAVADLVPRDDSSIRYMRLDGRATIGRKRQLACEAADGDVLVQWDDDDWYGATRLSRQVAPLAAGTADIAGILKGYLMDVPTFRFFKGGPPLHEGDLHASIVAGTLAFTRSAWRSTGGYPDRSIGEEVALLRAVLERGGRVAPIVNDGMYICVRHQANSWRLYYDGRRGPSGWTEMPPPEFLPADDLAFYRDLHG